MIVAAAFLPQPPLLLAEYASLADPGADLRTRCQRALAEVAAARVERLIVLAGADRHPPPISTRRPLGVRVAHELLTATGLHPAAEVVVPFDADPAEVAAAAEQVIQRAGGARTAILVMGDGSARRGEKAPGHLDGRAFDFDDAVTAALAAGDPAPLRGLDAALAGELLVAGRAAWQVLAAAAPGPARVIAADADDPFGVLYHVAVWSWA